MGENFFWTVVKKSLKFCGILTTTVKHFDCSATVLTNDLGPLHFAFFFYLFRGIADREHSNTEITQIKAILMVTTTLWIIKYLKSVNKHVKKPMLVNIQ